nr:unnamed protein product [Callosobruchus analis]
MELLGYLENIISNNNRWGFQGSERTSYISNNNRWFKICDKGDDSPAPSPESKKYATFILQVKS